MGFGLTDRGERGVLKEYFGTTSLTMTIYNDSTDTLSDTDNTGDITTEPEGSTYTRSSIDSGDITVSTVNGDAELSVAAKAFDVSDSTQNVDGYAFIDANGDLVHRGPIDTSDRETNYINLDQNDDVLLGGEPIVIG